MFECAYPGSLSHILSRGWAENYGTHTHNERLNCDFQLIKGTRTLIYNHKSESFFSLFESHFHALAKG